ncbi:MAG: DUF1816 domain-containing protein [Aphanocapsa lilacina HA4352-LM1]|jgi:hypothetical protein|uniref:DUF1816 domain-containing protein n=1 Tax=Gloeobacter morelensis MG652769 TaxID=2781736 RepID=A0ABY3PLR5_9CYAN|nr:DUF1816 domain-containing protein [Gloeobacter morelensis]MBW4700144.1 DUF1816 domain-containing protein [Aphanocapsa lilacina HA4352-LM1]UFP94539.1 DUF1816 domain-containing protein [Gloeobacter morelensis MG652769]
MQRSHFTENTMAWWLEMATDEPYLYLFGPFESPEEAEAAVPRHRADLISEGWQVLSATVSSKGPSGAFLVA